MNNKDISQFSLYEYWLFPLTRVPSSTSTPILFISYTYKYISFKIIILTLLKLMSVVFYIPHSCISDKNDFLNGVCFSSKLTIQDIFFLLPTLKYLQEFATPRILNFFV